MLDAALRRLYGPPRFQGARTAVRALFSGMIMGGDNGEETTGREDPPSMDGLSERLERMQSEHAPPPPQKGSASAWGQAMRVSSDLFAGLLVGGLLGYGLDYLLGVSPLFLLAGLFVGFAAGLRNMARTLKQDGENSSAD